MFGNNSKNESVEATLTGIREHTSAMHTMAASRGGLNLSNITSAWIGTFETADGETLELILKESQAEKMSRGMHGTVYYRDQIFVKMDRD